MIFCIYSNEGYLHGDSFDFNALYCSESADDSTLVCFESKEKASSLVSRLQNYYDNAWSDSLRVRDMTDYFNEV